MVRPFINLPAGTARRGTVGVCLPLSDKFDPLELSSTETRHISHKPGRFGSWWIDHTYIIILTDIMMYYDTMVLYYDTVISYSDIVISYYDIVVS